EVHVLRELRLERRVGVVRQVRQRLGDGLARALVVVRRELDEPRDERLEEGRLPSALPEPLGAVAHGPRDDPSVGRARLLEGGSPVRQTPPPSPGPPPPRPRGVPPPARRPPRGGPPLSPRRIAHSASGAR